MPSENEQVLILVKATPNWSRKYKEYEICTAGITSDNEWRRLYPFPEEAIIEKRIRLWDRIEVDVVKPTDDPRPESRKIIAKSVKAIDRIEDRNERRRILESIAEPSLDVPIQERRSMMLVRPRIKSFKIEKRAEEPIQVTLNGRVFKQSPYGTIRLKYQWRCPQPCQFCKDRYHNTECFDWGANYLYRKYRDENDAKRKVKQKCYYQMKYDYDSWFALGTHSQRPWKRWMIVGLLWMKKQRKPMFSDSI